MPARARFAEAEPLDGKPCQVNAVSTRTAAEILTSLDSRHEIISEYVHKIKVFVMHCTSLYVISGSASFYFCKINFRIASVQTF